MRWLSSMLCSIYAIVTMLSLNNVLYCWCFDCRTVPAEIIRESSSDDVTLQEGDTVVLKCNVTGIPSPQITWYRRPSTAMKYGHSNPDRTR